MIPLRVNFLDTICIGNNFSSGCTTNYNSEPIGNMDKTPLRHGFQQDSGVEGNEVDFCVFYWCLKETVDLCSQLLQMATWYPQLLYLKEKESQIKYLTIPAVGLSAYKTRAGWMRIWWSGGSEKRGWSTQNAGRLCWWWTPSVLIVRIG